MLLKEFIYFDAKHSEPQDDHRYTSKNDTSVLRDNDVRKTRLTLSMINDIRKAAEAHDQEVREEHGLIRKCMRLLHLKLPLHKPLI
jgi:hypothetical protein